MIGQETQQRLRTRRGPARPVQTRATVLRRSSVIRLRDAGFQHQSTLLLPQNLIQRAAFRGHRCRTGGGGALCSDGAGAVCPIDAITLRTIS